MGAHRYGCGILPPPRLGCRFAKKGDKSLPARYSEVFRLALTRHVPIAAVCRSGKRSLSLPHHRSR